MAFKIEDGVLKRYTSDHGEEEIVVPDGVTKIADNAFFHCAHLKNVTIPSSVVSVGKAAFEGCHKLQTIFNYSTEIFYVNGGDKVWFVSPNIPLSEYKKYKNSAVCGFLMHPEVDFGAFAEEYWNYFIEHYKSYCHLIASYDLCHALTVIADNNLITEKNYMGDFLRTFRFGKASRCIDFMLDWESKNVADAKNIKKLWKYSVGWCSDTICIEEYKGADTSVVIPEKIGKREVTEIGPNAFSGGSFITEINIPDSVNTICDYAFANCLSLTKINIPDNVRYIGRGVFGGCANFVDNNGFTIFNNILFGYVDYKSCDYINSKKEVTIPDGVTKICAGVFPAYNKYLQTINIPESVTEIDDLAFDGCPALTIRTPRDSYAHKYFNENPAKVKVIVND